MSITHVTYQGRTLMLHFDDGEIIPAFKMNSQMFIPQRRGKKVLGGGGGGSTPGNGTYSLAPESAIPDFLTGMHWRDGIVDYDRTQNTWAYRIVSECLKIPGITYEEMKAALMCALVESVLRMYANENVPESFGYPHDLVGSDADSVGLYQQRPSIPWGSVRDLMDVAYSTRAFIGGPDGPNSGDPRGFRDIPADWYSTLGEHVQDVQGSRFPDRYARVESTADQYLSLYLVSTGGGGGGAAVIDPFPGHYDASDPFGMVPWPPFRSQPHRGADWIVPAGSPIPAMAAGTVFHNEYGSVLGNTIGIKMDHFPYYYAYCHMLDTSPLSVGAHVNTGDIVGKVGNTGSASFGAHLHIALGGSEAVAYGGDPLYDPWGFINDQA